MFKNTPLEEQLMELLCKNLRGFAVNVVLKGETDRHTGVSVGKHRTVRLCDIIQLVRQHDAKIMIDHMNEFLRKHSPATGGEGSTAAQAWDALIVANMTKGEEGPASQTEGMGGDRVWLDRRVAHKHAVELEQCSIFAADVGDAIAKAMTDAAADLRAAPTLPETAEAVPVAVPVASFGAILALANELSWSQKTRDLSERIRTAIEIDRAAAQSASSRGGE